MPEQARLRVYGEGGVEVELVTAYLGDFNHAYASLLLFEATIDGMRRAAREFPFFPHYYPFAWDLALPVPRRAVRRIRDWPPSADEVVSYIPRAEQLVLSAVSLASPGFWEFLGTLNPFEVFRKYINDRHERKKDHEYRDSAEMRRLALENLSLENRVIAERIRMAKEIGATDRDLAPLLNELVYKPLLSLDHYQDRGVIEHAEIPPIAREG
jgi:hypothetical protein